MPITVSEAPQAAFDAVSQGIGAAGADLAYTRAERPVRRQGHFRCHCRIGSRIFRWRKSARGLSCATPPQ